VSAYDLLEPELAALAKTLSQRFVMHLNAGHGHTYGYELLDAAGRRIGSKSVFRPKRGGKAVVVYTLGDTDHDTAESFLRAYRQQLRDADWEAADPARRDGQAA
jgi:hypothetical protein